MITEADLDAINIASFEPDQRFRMIEQLAASRLVERDEHGRSRFNNFDYMVSVLAAAQLYDIEELEDWHLPAWGDEQSESHARDFRAHANRVSQRLLFEYMAKPERDPNTVALNDAAKERIRFHIRQIREAIEAAAWDNDRKDAMLAALRALEAEVDRSRSRMLKIIELIAQARDGAEPILDGLQRIATIFWGAKAEESARGRLPSGDKPKSIEPPKKQLPKPKNEFDDDLPF